MSVDFSHAQTTSLPDCELVYSFVEGESLEVYELSGTKCYMQLSFFLKQKL